jgi:hypothetical protein
LNEECLGQLEENPVLPFTIEHIQPNAANDAATARYDSTPTPGKSFQSSHTTRTPSIPFHNVVIADVDCHASSNELRAAALRHVKKKGGGYIQIPHDCEPANEFKQDSLLFPMIYPTLFPYGIGGPEDSKRPQPLSLKRHVKHLLNLSDQRFQEHPSFLFTAFNILQRREMLLHTSLKVKKSNFPSVVAQFASVSPEVVQRVSGVSQMVNQQLQRMMRNERF